MAKTKLTEWQKGVLYAAASVKNRLGLKGLG